MTRLGYQIPNFTFPGTGPGQLFETVAITVSLQSVACIAPTHDEARAELDAYLATRGIDVASLPEDEAEGIRSVVTYGDPDEVGERFSERLVPGIDGFTVAAPANGHLPGRVDLLGRTLSQVVG